MTKLSFLMSRDYVLYHFFHDMRFQKDSFNTEAPKKKKGMTHKVKNFLAGLPDLKHLYSKSVVT